MQEQKSINWENLQHTPLGLSNINFNTYLNNKIIELNKYVNEIYANIISSYAPMTLIYHEKFEQAIDYLSQEKINNLNNYPFLNAEINATGMDPKDIALNIVSQKANWIAKCSKIEEIRLTYKIKFNKVTNKKELDILYDEVILKIKELK